MEKPPQSEDKIAWNLFGRVMHEDMNDISDTIPKQTHRYFMDKRFRDSVKNQPNHMKKSLLIG